MPVVTSRSWVTGGVLSSGGCPPSPPPIDSHPCQFWPSTQEPPGSRRSSSTTQGGVLARGYREFAQLFPRPGWVEHEPDDIWTATVAACREALAATDAQPTCIGITDQRETAVVWDRRTMHSPRPAIVWQDRRTTAICDRLREDGAEERVTELTGLRLDPYFTGTKYAWLAAEEAQLWSRVRDGALALGTVDSYVIARLTGGAAHVTDPSNASRTLLYDIGKGGWSDELCDAVRRARRGAARAGAGPASSAPPTPMRSSAWTCPIAGIAGDQQAALFGQACFYAGMSKCTYGTGSFVLINTGSTPRALGRGPAHHVAWDLGDGLVYALEGAIFVTGAAVQWLRDGLGLIDSAAEIEGAGPSVPDSGDVVFVPALTGMGAPHWDPHARGAIIGITRGTTRAHLARATLEAIAFEVRDVVDIMVTEAGLEVPELSADGAPAQRPAAAAPGRPARVAGPPSEGHRDDGAGRGLPRRTGNGRLGVDPSWRRRWSLDRRFEPREGHRDDGRHDRWRDAVGRAGKWTR